LSSSGRSGRSESSGKGREEVRQSTLELARFAALEVDNLINQAEALLSGLAEAPPVKRLDPRVTDAIFSRLLPRYPFYENIIAYDTRGRMYGTALDPRKKIFLGDRAFFRASMQSNALTVGEPIIGRIKAKPLVILSYPVWDDAGRRVGTGAATLGLLLVQKILAEVPVPEGAIISSSAPMERSSPARLSLRCGCSRISLRARCSGP
jgi:hypothetical protein